MYKSLFIALLIFFISCQNCKAQNIKDPSNIFESYIDSGFTGVVLVVKNDSVVLQKAYGFANEEKIAPQRHSGLFVSFIELTKRNSTVNGGLV